MPQSAKAAVHPAGLILLLACPHSLEVAGILTPQDLVLHAMNLQAATQKACKQECGLNVLGIAPGCDILSTHV